MMSLNKNWFGVLILSILIGCNQTPTETAVSEVAATATTVVIPTDTPIPPTATTPPPTATIPPPTATTEAVSDAKVAPEIIKEDATIEAADGTLVHFTYRGIKHDIPRPGIILLHMLGGNRTVWEDNRLADTLFDNGYAVLSVDMRGHGETPGTRNWDAIGEDLLQIWDAFTAKPEVNGEKTAVIGASIGANMALQTATNQPAIKAVVLLSAGLDYAGVTTTDTMMAYGQRPILIVAANNDTYAANSSRSLRNIAQGNVQLEIYEGNAHGTNIFTTQPELTELLISWLDQSL